MVLAMTAALLLMFLAAPAAAHTDLVDSEPQNGASLDHPPTALQLRFSEAISPDFAAVVIIPGSGAEPVTVAATAQGALVTADMGELASRPLPASIDLERELPGRVGRRARDRGNRHLLGTSRRILGHRL